jgi:hypothetical protein
MCTTAIHIVGALMVGLGGTIGLRGSKGQPPPLPTPHLTNPSIRGNLSPKIFPFMENLYLLDLLKIINDPIIYDAIWPFTPTKLSLDIPKFEGKIQEDPWNHIMNFNLWCTFNNIMKNCV